MSTLLDVPPPPPPKVTIEEVPDDEPGLLFPVMELDAVEYLMDADTVDDLANAPPSPTGADDGLSDDEDAPLYRPVGSLHYMTALLSSQDPAERIAGWLTGVWGAGAGPAA